MRQTLAYADVFDYPLTREEVFRWLIKGDSLPLMKKAFYHLPGRESLIVLRRGREQVSRIKLKKLNSIVRFLKLIPWIKLICVTGALAMNNADQNDDIDLMIITQTNRLWLTRLVAIILLFPWLRRGRKIDNRLCLNLWLDETSLAIKQRNLYIAHEICQAKPILNRDNTYQKFIGANLWYKHYLPNWTI